MEEDALSEMEEFGRDLRADFVLFPHHGGLPGTADAGGFAERLISKSKPAAVLYSIGRGAHGTPRLEVIAGVRKAAPDCWIACTQLSDHCAAVTRSKKADLWWTSSAKGYKKNACCSGSIKLVFDEKGTLIFPTISSHQTFVTGNAPTALCQIKF